MSNSTMFMSPEVKDYIRMLEDALTDVIDGEQSHDIVASTGLTEERADELVAISNLIINRGIGMSFPGAVIPPAPADLSTLLEKLEAGGVESEELDSAVDAAASKEASNVNNCGIEEQVRYLKRLGMSDASIIAAVGLKYLKKQPLN